MGNTSTERISDNDFIRQHIYIYIVYMWQMSPVFSHESAQRNDAGHLICENVFKTTRPFCYQWFRVSTRQAMLITIHRFKHETHYWRRPSWKCISNACVCVCVCFHHYYCPLCLKTGLEFGPRYACRYSYQKLLFNRKVKHLFLWLAMNDYVQPLITTRCHSK